ncbi:MAG: DUF1883 domain-containing protein [Anaerolineales bacterium]
MDFVHYDLNHLSTDDIVEVSLDKQANVRLLDQSNFNKYKKGQTHTCLGGLAKSSPICLSPSHSGHWYIVIDLGSYTGSIKSSVRTIKG